MDGNGDPDQVAAAAWAAEARHPGSGERRQAQYDQIRLAEQEEKRRKAARGNEPESVILLAVGMIFFLLGFGLALLLKHVGEAPVYTNRQGTYTVPLDIGTEHISACRITVDGEEIQLLECGPHITVKP